MERIFAEDDGRSFKITKIRQNFWLGFLPHYTYDINHVEEQGLMYWFHFYPELELKTDENQKDDEDCECKAKKDAIDCITKDQFGDLQGNKDGRNLSVNEIDKIETVLANQKKKQFIEADELLVFKANDENEENWNNTIVDCLNEVYAEGAEEKQEDVSHTINSRTRLKNIEKLLKVAMKNKA